MSKLYKLKPLQWREVSDMVLRADTGLREGYKITIHTTEGTFHEPAKYSYRISYIEYGTYREGVASLKAAKRLAAIDYKRRSTRNFYEVRHNDATREH